MTKQAARAMATLRHIAALGLPAVMVFRDVTRCLAEVAPFETATLVLYDDELHAADAMVAHDVKPVVANRYFQRWFNQDEARYMPSHAQAALGGTPDLFRVSDYNPRLWDSELYDEVFRDLGFGRMGSMMLRQGSRAVGNLSFGRGVQNADYSDADLKALNEAAAYTALALAPRDVEPGLYETAALDEVASAIVLTNRRGEVVELSGNGWGILRHAAMAYLGPNPPLSTWRGDPLMSRDGLNDAYAWARPLLAELARRVTAGLTGAVAPAAVLRRASPHGEFVLKAYAMAAPTSADPAETIVVQISRRTPLEARLFSSLLFLSLTPQEQVVCRLLLKGRSQGDIAAELGVSPHTVVSHVRGVYRATGAHGRESLQPAIFARPTLS